MTRIRFIEWFLAIILVVALHGAALTGWVWVAPKSALSQLPAKTPEPAQSIEPSGDGSALDIVVTLIEPDQSPEQAAAGSNRTVIQPPQETVAAPAPAAQPAPAVEPAPVAQPVPAAEPAPAQSSTVVQQVEPVVDLNKDTSQIASISPEPASTLELPPLDEIPDAEPAIEEPASVQAPAEPAAPAAAPEPAPAPSASSSPVRDPVPIPKAKPASAPAPSQPAAPAATPPAAEQQVAAAQPEQATATETPVSAAKSVYYRQLIAKIKRARVYPSDARRAGKQGTVYMQIVVKRNGRIASYDIVKSSGHKELDDAAVQTLVKANPVDPFPDEVPGEELKFGVPLRYAVDAS